MIENISQVEYEPPIPHIGLQTRLLIGGSSLHPNNEITQLNIDSILSFEDRDYTPFEQASRSERNNYWQNSSVSSPEDQIQAWAQNLNDSFQSRSFTEGEKQLFQNIGVNAQNFSTDAALEIYNRYFNQSQKEPIDSVKLFIYDILHAHINLESQVIDWNLLNHNISTIEWFAKIFGEKSSQIISQLTDAEAVFINSPEVFRNLDLANRLEVEKIELLEFLSPFIAPNEEQDPEKVTSTDPYEVADQLVDYSTGLANETEIDLTDSFASLLETSQLLLDTDHPLIKRDEPVVILSNVTYAMIDRIASKANELNREIAFIVQGLPYLHNENSLLLFGAFAVPSNNYDNLQKHTTQHDQELYDRNGLTVAHATGLSQYNRMVVSGHVHQSQLGSKWNVTPSPQDEEVMAHWLEWSNRPFLSWMIATKSENELCIRSIYTYKEGDEIKHKDIPFITESEINAAVKELEKFDEAA